MIYRFDRLESTQVEARRLAAEGAAHGTVVVAESQSGGRGRLGRSWESEAGQNLLLSVVLRPQLPASQTALVGLGAAAGVADALGLLVKWPNDLVSAEGLKVGGFLGEVEWEENRVRSLVLGLGLNVNQRDFPAHLPHATSLAILFGPQDRERVLSTVVAAILEWAEHPDRLHLWRRRAHTIGRVVTVAGRTGVATGLRNDGALLIDGEPVLTGEVGATG